jgi:hypothetical protein
MLLCVESDGFDAQHVFPVGLVLKDLPQLGLCGFTGQEQIERFPRDMRASQCETSTSRS